MTHFQSLVYKFLYEAAVTGLSCPTNTNISEKFSLSSGQVSRIITALVKSGHIKTSRPDPRRGERIITICEIDKSTGLTLSRHDETEPSEILTPIEWPNYSPHNLRFK